MSITINKCIGESSPVYLYCSKVLCNVYDRSAPNHDQLFHVNAL